MSIINDLAKPIFDALNDDQAKEEKFKTPEVRSTSTGNLPPAISSTPGHTYTFGTSLVNPPSQLFVQENDILSLNAVTSQTSEVFTLTASILTGDRIQTITDHVTTSATGTLSMKLPEGFLISAGVSVSVATIRAQSYFNLSILNQAGDFRHNIIAGYATKNKPLSFPPISIEDSLSGYGNSLSPTGYIVSGTSYRWIIPANRQWKILTATGLYMTSSAVLDRYAVLTYNKIGTGAFAFFFGIKKITASLIYRLHWSNNIVNLDMTEINGSSTLEQPLSSMLLPATFQIYMNFQIFDADDSLLTPQLYVEEFLTL
jgi:hypothetical protein